MFPLPRCEGQDERTKIRNIFGTKFRGALGKEMVASTWKGHDYIREYVTPGGEPSDLQLEQREFFSRSVTAWQALSPRQQEFYERIANGMSGYNLFIGRAVPTLRAGKDLEVPIPLQYGTEDGKPVVDGWLIVRRSGGAVFLDSLKDAKGVIALTPSDGPYTFVLRKGTQEDIVLEVKDLLETDVPLVLESTALGIKLVLDVIGPETEKSPPSGTALAR